MEYNRENFQQAYQTKVYNDKIYNELKEDRVRNRILKGQLRREDCDDEDVFEFLSLLKQLENWEQKNEFQLISEEEQVESMKRAEKRSASSIFLKRTYVLCKCTLASKRMMRLLVKFYNILIIKQYFPLRQMKLLDVILE